MISEKTDSLGTKSMVPSPCIDDFFLSATDSATGGVRPWWVTSHITH